MKRGNFVLYNGLRRVVEFARNGKVKLLGGKRWLTENDVQLLPDRPDTSEIDDFEKWKGCLRP